MGGKQSKPEKSRRTFSNDNPIHISKVAEHRALMSEMKTDELIKSVQTDLQPPYREVTSGYDIKKEGDSWKKKIDSLKSSHSAINKAIEKEYERALCESAKMFKKSENIDPPCTDLEALVYKCYRDNPNQTILCAKVVNDYKKCVTNKRPTVKVTNP